MKKNEAGYDSFLSPRSITHLLTATVCFHFYYNYTCPGLALYDSIKFSELFFRAPFAGDAGVTDTVGTGRLDGFDAVYAPVSVAETGACNGFAAELFSIGVSGDGGAETYPFSFCFAGISSMSILSVRFSDVDGPSGNGAPWMKRKKKNRKRFIRLNHYVVSGKETELNVQQQSTYR